MANILLSHSYFLRFDAKAWGQMKPYPPLGTLYAASVLRNVGHTVHFFDTMFAESEKEIIPYLEKHKPEIVIFYEDNFNFLSKMCLTRMREACFTMGGYAKEYGAKVIVQGSDPIDHLAEYFGNSVDIIICGEGEHTVVELLEALGTEPSQLSLSDHDATLRPIDGIAFPSKEGIKVNPKRRLINDLDSIPFPAWDLVDMDTYRTTWVNKHGYFSLNLVTTRGCPFHCNWCAKPVYGQVYNSRTPENVAQELQLLKETYKPDHIWFADDILGLKPGWLKQFSEEVQQRGIKTPFVCQTRADLLLKESNIKNMASAGAETVWIGAESGSQSVLDAMDKGTTVQQIMESTRLMQQEGIKVAWFLQFGYLGETESDIQKTLGMVRSGQPDDIGISVSYPLPGTPFFEKVKSLMPVKQNWVDSGDLDLMFPGTFPPEYYKNLHVYAHRTFRFRQGIKALLSFDFSMLSLRRIVLLPLNAIRFTIALIRMQWVKRNGPVSAYKTETAIMQS